MSSDVQDLPTFEISRGRRAISWSGERLARVLGAIRSAVGGRGRSPWWMEVGAIVWLCWVYDDLAELAPLRVAAAVSHARAVLAFERTLHLDPELTLNRWLAGHPSIGLIASDYYDNAHFIVTLGLLGYLWWFRSDIYRPLRNALVLVNVIAFVIFWRYPMAPPRLLVGDGFTDVVAVTHAFGSWHTGSLASHADQLASMPSLHMAWATWSALVVWKITRRWWVRAVAVVYPFITAYVVIATGNHFLMDVLAGVATLVVAVGLVKAISLMRLADRIRRGLPAIGIARPSTRSLAHPPGTDRGVRERTDGGHREWLHPGGLERGGLHPGGLERAGIDQAGAEGVDRGVGETVGGNLA